MHTLLYIGHRPSPAPLPVLFLPQNSASILLPPHSIGGQTFISTQIISPAKKKAESRRTVVEFME